MAEPFYKSQVSLMLQVLPEVAKEECFALHGGTAINLFVRDMPRLSVDIDLTYIPIEDRNTSFQRIAEALLRIKENITNILPSADIQFQKDISKLQVVNRGVQIKIEVNQTNRGLLEPPVKLVLCNSAQEEFDAFCATQVVSIGQLYGGKICAALDRQHPRDLFDVKLMLENEGLTEEIKKGLILCILSSNRPIHELLSPNLLDQSQAFINQFEGMTIEPFTYEEYEATRLELIKTIQNNLEDQDKKFLLSLKELSPNWSIYNFERFPSVQWKSQNLKRLKEDNPRKHLELSKLLNELLDSL
ncbi:putative nucleotidyltransferase component of viral defense system [Roseivirga ehrenbergii]|uniref:Nucleotidyltransferase n=1 Tax=Roseivirga ehrenbergii (strain DSM 102268 / JCM 13514 / KCTC 12282 / NCIMB 14502 / KMM 6017) TaxID=279360 RepID=A0A150XBZ2_ROSEK|nr:nucleotidyl transferase AbiEii/AbiGii toxin family protein [Roseivirga ehrenbergii]KYG76192.1 nucleotidyltransferase [Roseivirga ehrenbergii]TCL00283.1 putative nucleotidyltransferase component of viral defense system [Roseivirga ehrenbergii]